MLELNKVYNMDCIEGMREIPDKHFELAIVDPPYGIGEHGGKNRSGFVKQKNGNRLWVNGFHERRSWDREPCQPETITEIFRVSKRQIIWGCNNFNYPFGPGRIVWDKCQQGTDQSDCEIAYNSEGKKVDLFRFMWRGMMQGKGVLCGEIQQGNKKKNEKRIHPTQKPIALYKWLLKNYAKPGDKILDTHVGSGSSIIACIDMGFEYMGFEIDEGYYKAMQERIYHFTRQTVLI